MLLLAPFGFSREFDRITFKKIRGRLEFRSCLLKIGPRLYESDADFCEDSGPRQLILATYHTVVLTPCRDGS